MPLPEIWVRWEPIWCAGIALALRTGIFLHWDLQGGLWKRLAPTVRARIVLVPVVGAVAVALLAFVWRLVPQPQTEGPRFLLAFAAVTLTMLSCKGAEALFFRIADRPSGGRYDGAVTEEQIELAHHD